MIHTHTKVKDDDGYFHHADGDDFQYDWDDEEIADDEKKQQQKSDDGEQREEQQTRGQSGDD